MDSVSDVAKTIQTAVAPVFFLAAISSFLNVLAGRLTRIVDRARRLENLHGASTGPAHALQVDELRQLDRRMQIVSHAIVLSVGSAIAICLVIAALFVAELARYDLADLAAVIFLIALLLLVASLVNFLIEVRLAIRTIRVREALLEKD